MFRFRYIKGRLRMNGVLFTDSSLEEIYTSLKILANIKENQKICVENGSILVDTTDERWQWLVRTIFGNSKKRTVEQISKLINQCVRICTFIIENMNDIAGDNSVEYSAQRFYSTAKQSKEKHLTTLARLNKDMKSSTIGLNNIKQTYKSDINIGGKVDCILDNITEQILINEKVLNANSSKTKTVI